MIWTFLAFCMHVRAFKLDTNVVVSVTFDLSSEVSYIDDAVWVIRPTAQPAPPRRTQLWLGMKGIRYEQHARLCQTWQSNFVKNKFPKGGHAYRTSIAHTSPCQIIRDPFVMHTQPHDCWWPGAPAAIIRGLVMSEYTSFNTRSVYGICKLHVSWDTLKKADYRLAPGQWEMALQSNAISHWLGAKPIISPGLTLNALWPAMSHSNGVRALSPKWNKYR